MSDKKLEVIKNKKIREAVKRGDLIDYDELFASYPKKRQEEILRRARYIMAAAEVRRLRKKLRLTQSELAEKMNVKRELVSRVESGKQNVTLETLYQIAEATGKKFTFKFK